MPARYTIDKPRRLVIGSASGRVTVKDILRYHQNLLSDPEFDPSFSQLLDLTRVTRALVTAEDVRAVAEPNIYSLTSRRALLVRPDDNNLYGLARQFETIREEHGECAIRVFRDRDEALFWVLLGE